MGALKQINPDYVEASIKLRPAKADDFKVMTHKIINNVQVDELQPKYGQIYWQRSGVTNLFDNSPQYIEEGMDWMEFKEQMRRDMIWVPINGAWLEEEKGKHS